MTNTDPGAPEYEFDWQNPSKQSFDVGRVVSSTFGVLKNNLIPFMLVTFVGAGIPMMFFSMWPVFLGVGEGINIFDPSWAEGIPWEGIIGPAIALYLLYMVLIIIVYAAVIHMTMNALNEREVRLGEALKSSLGLFLPLLAIGILVFFGMVIGFVPFVIPGIFIMLGCALAFHIKVIEGGSIFGAISRSWTLSRGYKRWILLMMIIFGVLGAVIGLIFQLPVLFFGNSQTALLEGGSMTFWVINAIATGLSQMVNSALSYIGLTVTYFEIRRVKEGVDFDKLAAIFS